MRSVEKAVLPNQAPAVAALGTLVSGLCSQSAFLPMLGTPVWRQVTECNICHLHCCGDCLSTHTCWDELHVEYVASYVIVPFLLAPTHRDGLLTRSKLVH